MSCYHDCIACPLFGLLRDQQESFGRPVDQSQCKCCNPPCFEQIQSMAKVDGSASHAEMLAERAKGRF